MSTDRVSRIEYVPLDELLSQLDPRNPKGHDLDALRASIHRFGFVAPVVRNETDGRVLAGHGRAAALAALRRAGERPPLGIPSDPAGSWLVPVVTGIGLAEAEAGRYLVADNQLVIAGGWDDAALAELLREFEGDGLGFGGLGFDLEELDALLMEAGEAADDATATDDPDFELTEEPWVAPGDVYVLGEHRLAVGDASDPAVVRRALGAEQPALLVTDPPYGVAYTGKTREQLRIRGDDLSPGATRQLVSTVFGHARDALLPGAGFYVCAPGGDMEPVIRAATETLGPVRQSIVWAKDAFVLGRSDYHWQHELVFYGWTPGRHHWFGGRSQGTVWEVPRPRRSSEHPTMKPVALLRRMIENSSRVGDLVFDPFAGSGSTLLAAHRTRRRAAVIEVDPRFAQVVIERWQQLSGLTAQKEGPTC